MDQEEEGKEGEGTTESMEEEEGEGDEGEEHTTARKPLSVKAQRAEVQRRLGDEGLRQLNGQHDRAFCEQNQDKFSRCFELLKETLLENEALKAANLRMGGSAVELADQALADAGTRPFLHDLVNLILASAEGDEKLPPLCHIQFKTFGDATHNMLAKGPTGRRYSQERKDLEVIGRTCGGPQSYKRVVQEGGARRGAGCQVSKRLCISH